MTPQPVASYLEHLASALDAAEDDERRRAIADLMADDMPVTTDQMLATLRVLSWSYDGPSTVPLRTISERLINSLIRAVQPGAPLGR